MVPSPWFARFRWFGFGVLLLSLTGTAQAIGLGAVDLRSGLQQRLEARIELVGLRPEDLDNVLVTLADDEGFERHGLKREAIHLDLQFEIIPTGDDTGYVQVMSTYRIREPSLVFVVELTLRGGRRIRAYSLLLDTR